MPEAAARGERSLAERWRYALKPASWPKLLVPAALGQALGVRESLSVSGVVIGALTTVGLLASIVLLNDWADRDVDRIKREMFPRGCSPKTIPDGILPAHHLLFGGLIAGLFTLVVAAISAMWGDRPLAFVFAAMCLSIFFAYSLPPFKLNYRGGGELLEMAGVGVALPLFQAYLQGGSVFVHGTSVLPGLAMLCLSSAIASGLSDERSDRRGGKRTIITLFGNERGRRSMFWCARLGLGAWALAALWGPSGVPRWALAGAVVSGALHLARAASLSPDAQTDAFRIQGRLKQHLHRAIWHPTGLVAVSSVIAKLGVLP